MSYSKLENSLEAAKMIDRMVYFYYYTTIGIVG